MTTHKLLGIAVALTLAACGSSGSGDTKSDAPASATSSVIVVANCTGIATTAIGATVVAGPGLAFAPTTATITKGQYVKFTSSGGHTMVNQPGAAATSTFLSGAVDATSCLQFTASGTFPWMCSIHGMSMTGTLTVN